MEKIKEMFKKPLALPLGALLLGMILGLVVLGWGVWPLEWVDAAPADMQMDYQRDYLCMTIDSYIRNQDSGLVQLRWKGLGENASELLDTLTPAVCGFSSSKEIEALKEMVPFVAAPKEQAGVETEQEGGLMGQSVAIEEVKPENSFSIIPLLILVVLTVVVGGVFVILMKRRSAGGSAPKIRNAKSRQPAQAEYKGSQAASGPAVKDPPLAQFMTTYRQGDDLYDDSFSIDSVNGEFLGECGVGIAETIGVGEPKKVAALEVWLFDKNDIQTVTKVLMSEYASEDSSLRQRLLSKGEPIKAEPGMSFVMETATLQLEAKVIDMVYARGPLPEDSNFSRLTMEISVWAK